EEAQKDIRLLAVEVDRLRDTDQLDFYARTKLRERRQPPRQIAAGNPFHGGNTDNLRRRAFAADECVFQVPGVTIHLLDVLEQTLRLASHRDTLPAEIGPIH